MPRKQKKYHYIYKTTCDITGKYYIGMHSTDDLDDGYMGSGKRLWFSLNYHGKENHTKEILEFCDNREELKKREAEIVDDQLLTEDLCMNLKTGGQGGFSSEEHRRKFMESVNYEASHERIKWLRKNDSNWNKALSDNIKTSLKKCNFDHATFKGKKHSEETKNKISEAMKNRGTGKNNSQYGTMWIHCKATGEVKKIKKEDWFSYTLVSSCIWEKGRN